MTEGGCDGDVCITCSDQLLEVIVTSVSADGGTALGRCDGSDCEISVELLDGVVAGERLLVHGGVALQRGSLEASR